MQCGMQAAMHTETSHEGLHVLSFQPVALINDHANMIGRIYRWKYEVGVGEIGNMRVSAGHAR